MLDLGLVVADKDMDLALRGILERHHSLHIRPIRFRTIVFPRHDAGVRMEGPDELALLRHECNYGIIMLDRDGSGHDGNALGLEAELDDRLRVVWGDRAKAIVIEPELDTWIWGSNNAIKQALDCDIPDIRAWLQAQGFEFDGNNKPLRPKEAFEKLMHELRVPRSSSYYKKICSHISLPHCVDPAFRRFNDILQGWFAP